MTKERAIAAGNHRAGISQQRFNRMTCGGLLPVVAIEPVGSENCLRDLLLGGAIAIPVETLQHSAQSHPLLMGQPCVGWNDAAVKSAEQTADRGDSVEALNAERNKSGNRVFG